MKKILVLISLFISTCSFAQDSPAPEPSLLPDRLTNEIYSANYSAGVMPPGALQLQADLVYISEKWGDDVKYRWGSFPDFRLRYGILKGLELRAGTRIGLAYRDITFAPIGESDPILQFKNPYAMLHMDYVTLGLKARLLSYHRNQGTLTVLAESYLPVLRPSEAFGPSFVPTITFINADRISPFLAYTINAAAYFNYENRNELTQGFKLSLFPIFKLSTQAQLYLGAEGKFMQAGFTSAGFHSGLLYAPGPAVQLKANFSTERSRNALFRNYQGQLGVAWRVDSR